MKIGTADVAKIYFGSAEVSKVYLGSIEVYSSSITPTPEPTEKRLFQYNFEETSPEFYAENVTCSRSNLVTSSSYHYTGNNSMLLQTGASWFDVTVPNNEPESYTVEFWLQYERFINQYLATGCLVGSCSKDSNDKYSGFEIWTQANQSIRYNIAKDSTGPADGGMVYLSCDTSNTRNGWVHVCIVKTSTGAFYGGLQGKLVLINAENKCGWQQLIRFGDNVRNIRYNTSNFSYLDNIVISKTNTLKDFNTEALTYTLPDAPQTKTMFLSHFETGNDVSTDSLTTYTTASGSNTINITSSYAKFGSHSFQSDFSSWGSNNWFSITTENEEPEEYTVEGWLFPLGNEAKFVIGSCASVEGGVYNGFEIWTQDNGTVRYNITNNAGAVDGGMKYLPEATPNNWHHFALVKSKQGIFGALDGKLVLVNADSTKLGWQKVINVGKAIRTNNVLPYPLDELRITKYNSLKNFDATNLTYTVPTEAFNWE